MNAGYFENERPEVIRLADSSLKVVLDVGCGHGRMGSRLMENLAGRRVYGIELVADAAKKAKGVLTGVVCGDIETMRVPFKKNFFDCIIFADVLEHVRFPQEILRKLRPFLKPGGVIICSIPNMRHYTVILRLLMRGWEYEDFGHFDRTHLRFFSERSAKELISDAGFAIERIEPRLVASRKVRALNALCFGAMNDFLAFQYVVKARKPA